MTLSAMKEAESLINSSILGMNPKSTLLTIPEDISPNTQNDEEDEYEEEEEEEDEEEEDEEDEEEEEEDEDDI